MAERIAQKWLDLRHKMRSRLENKSMESAGDIAAAIGIFMVSVLKWTVPVLGLIPGFNLLLFSLAGTRAGLLSVPDTNKTWESGIKNVLKAAFALTLVASLITAAVVFAGAASFTTATALPYLYMSLAGFGLLHTGVSFFSQLSSYLKMPESERTPFVKHKLATTATSFVFQAALVTALVCLIAVPAAQPALLIALPLAVAAMAAYKYFVERPRSERLAQQDKTVEIIDDNGIALKQKHTNINAIGVVATPAVAITDTRAVASTTVARSGMAPSEPALGERTEERRPLMEEVVIKEKRLEPAVAPATLTVTSAPSASSTMGQGIFDKRTSIDDLGNMKKIPSRVGSFDPNDQTARVNTRIM